MSTKQNENEMTPTEMAEAIKTHGGDPSMTLGDALGALVSAGKVKVAKESGNKNKGNKVAAVAPVLKFSFQKPLPKVARFLSPEEEQEVIEGERQYRADKAEALKAFATQIEHLVPDLVTSLRAFAAKPEEVRNLPGNKDKDKANRSGLADILNQEDSDAKVLAVKAVSASFVLTCPKRRRDVEDVMDKLVNYDLIIKSVDQDRISKDGVRAYDTNYQLSKGFADDLEALEIMRDLRNLVRETRSAGREFYQTLEKAFEQKNDNPMSVDNLLALIYEEPAEKKSGTVILDNPAHEERGITYQGGRILYGVNDNKKLFVIDGLGGTQRVARNLAEMGTFLFLNQLREERVRFTDNMGDIARKNVALLHKLARIGIRTMREKTEKEANEKAAKEAAVEVEAKFVKEREAVLAMAGEVAVISNEEFLLNGKPGAMLLEHLQDPWIRKDKRSDGKSIETAYPHARNALVIRQDDGKILVKCPERLKTLYQGAQQEAFPGDKFAGLEYPLGGMLRIMWGVTKGQKDEADRKAKSEATETGTDAQ